MMLEVEDGNEPALALYQQLGFVTLARRSNYYGPGRDALVMALPLGEQG
jgi:ribosomal protein S18 acetylase RimI-like enzyme